MRYIKAVDGFTGCYRGLVPKLCAYTVNGVIMEKVNDSYLFTKIFPQVQDDDEDIEELPEEKRLIIIYYHYYHNYHLFY